MKLQLFLAKRDFNRPVEHILADLIFLATGYRVSLYHTKFGLPRSQDQRPDLRYDANSYVPAAIDPAWDASFPGNNGFLYYRMPLALLVDGRTLTINHSEDFKTHDVLDHINTQLGSQLGPQDLVNNAYTGGSAVVIALQAAETSLVWNNAPVPEFPPFDLSTLDELDLYGLVYTQPVV